MQIVVVTGPSGCGKTTVGSRAAQHAMARFFDADDYHLDQDRQQMSRGLGLTDVQRKPWVDRIAAAIREADAERVVLACSALNTTVRSWLTDALPAKPVFVRLEVSPELLTARLRDRGEHFAGQELLPSQLAASDPTGTIPMDGTKPPTELAKAIAAIF